MRRVRYYLGGALFWGAFLAVCVLLFWNAQRLARAAGGISLRYGEALEPRVVASALEYARDGRNNAAWSPTFWAVRQGVASANGREETVRMLRVCGDAELLATEPLLYGALPGPAGQGGCAVSSALAWQLWGALDVTGLELELDGERYTVRGVFESGEARAVTQEAADSRTAEYANVELTAMETAPEGTEAALAFAGASGLGTPAHVVDGPALARAGLCAVLAAVGAVRRMHAVAAGTRRTAASAVAAADAAVRCAAVFRGAAARAAGNGAGGLGAHALERFRLLGGAGQKRGSAGGRVVRSAAPAQGHSGKVAASGAGRAVPGGMPVCAAPPTRAAE